MTAEIGSEDYLTDLDSDVNKTTQFKTKTKTKTNRPIETKTVTDKTDIKTQISAHAMAINRWQTGRLRRVYRTVIVFAGYEILTVDTDLWEKIGHLVLLNMDTTKHAVLKATAMDQRKSATFRANVWTKDSM